VHVQHYRTCIKWQTIVHRAGKTESSVGHKNFEFVTTNYVVAIGLTEFYNKPVAESCVHLCANAVTSRLKNSRHFFSLAIFL